MLVVCVPVHDKRRPRKLAKGNIQSNFYLSEHKDLKSFDLKTLILTISRLSQILVHIAQSVQTLQSLCTLCQYLNVSVSHYLTSSQFSIFMQGSNYRPVCFRFGFIPQERLKWETGFCFNSLRSFKLQWEKKKLLQQKNPKAMCF